MDREIGKEYLEQEVIKHFGEEFFGKLTPYIADIDVTDINYSNNQVWINHVTDGRYMVEGLDYTEEDATALAYRVCNTENVQFNQSHPVLSADLHDLRFHFTHSSFSVSGTAVSIRKTPIVMRITSETMRKGKVQQLTEKAEAFLKAAVESRFNTVLCGLTGTGKTEWCKTLIKNTRPNERIITIEDTSELHLSTLFPEKDIVELKVNQFIDYEGAIKTCMRMLPTWLLLSEARGKEIKDLIKSISTGAKIITTLHADDARQIPSRMLNMFEDNELSNDKIENMIYDYIDLGIHVRADFKNGTTRYIDKIVYFELDTDGNKKCHDLYSVKHNADGTYSYYYHEMPKSLVERLENNDCYLAEQWKGVE